MSAMKTYAMSGAGQLAAQRALDLAEARWANMCAACALAEATVDRATLDALLYPYARDLGEAHDMVAVSLGYEHMHHMLGV